MRRGPRIKDERAACGHVFPLFFSFLERMKSLLEVRVPADSDSVHSNGSVPGGSSPHQQGRPDRHAGGAAAGMNNKEDGVRDLSLKAPERKTKAKENRVYHHSVISGVNLKRSEDVIVGPWRIKRRRSRDAQPAQWLHHTSTACRAAA